MADLKHFEWLQEGVASWNHRRRERHFSPDLSGALLDNRNLEGVDFSETKLAGASLRRTKLRGADFRNADFALERPLPDHGAILFSIADDDKATALLVAEQLLEYGFSLLATRGTGRYFQASGIEAQIVNKVLEGRPHVVERIRSGDVAILFNSDSGGQSLVDSASMRRSAREVGIPRFFSIAAIDAAARELVANRPRAQNARKGHPGADLRLADLSFSNCEGASFNGAKLQGTDLTTASGLNQEQIDTASGNGATMLPPNLSAPARWPKLENAENIRLNPALFERVGSMKLPSRINDLLNEDNLVFVGDLVHKTENDLLHIRFRKSELNKVKSELAIRGLSLGMHVPGWPPENIEEFLAEAAWSIPLSRLKQAPLGTKFQIAGDWLTIDAAGDDTDATAAAEDLTRQIHEEVKRKSLRFSSVAHGSDNTIGWSGLGDASRRFDKLVHVESAQLPLQIGTLYSVLIELGSFLELDQKLHKEQDSNASPLRPEIRRPLEDLVRTAAPWLRRFPTARALDDESGQFLTRNELLLPAEVTIQNARRTELISQNDFVALKALLGAATRGEFQGQKARTRGVLSAMNLAIAAATILGSIYLEAVGGNLAGESVLAEKAADFLASTEHEVLQFFSDASADIRGALNGLLTDLQDRSAIIPRGPSVPPPRGILATRDETQN